MRERKREQCSYVALRSGNLRKRKYEGNLFVFFALREETTASTLMKQCSSLVNHLMKTKRCCMDFGQARKEANV